MFVLGWWILRHIERPTSKINHPLSKVGWVGWGLSPGGKTSEFEPTK
jgi:hypothetical protein